MVKIDKMVMEGFKSFKRKVSVPINSGFSVVTGPNGSGKTNIADAIYFVLGSGSSRPLRAKRAHELIFQGNRVKKQSDYAKVVMHLENADRAIPVDTDTVTVSRRVNRAGVSTYRLSGKISTRQEVTDILAQAGITSDGHNLIQQGDVNRIVDMNPIERRGIIDEIAGITEYDEKKEKAMKELAKVDEKVREAEIVLEQKDEILTKIKSERDVALEYRSLQDTLRLVNATVILKNLRTLEKRLQESEKGTTANESEFENLSKEIEKLERQISVKESEMEAITKEILKASSRMEEAGRVSELESRISMKKERIKMNQREIERISEMIDRLSTLDRRESPAVKAVLDKDGVKGTFSQLVMAPPKYKVAVEVAAGGHLGDVIVESHVNAAECIKYLKGNRIGRARFLPMDKISPRPKQDLPRGAIGWLADLVHHDPKYTNIVNYIMGSTMCVNDIDKAREMMENNGRHRMVTLDGDIVERSGAMTGGFYKKGSGGGANITQYLDNRTELEKENETLRLDMERLEDELKSIGVGKENYESVKQLEEKRAKISRETDEIRESRDAIYENRASLQQESGKINIRRAKYEANLEMARTDWETYKDMEDRIKKSKLYSQPVRILDDKKLQMVQQMDAMGPVNLKAIEEFDSFKEEFDDFRDKVDKIVKEKKSIESTIDDIEKKKREIFTVTLENLARHFKKIYAELTNGEADLKLEVVRDMEMGLLIYASPPGKRLLNIDSMSTGEKTLTAFAFLFAIQNHKPAPFYVLDEADAALDKSNTKRVAELVRRHSKLAQFLIVSHNDHMIKEADQVYGVSMEDGESKIIGVKLPEN